MDSTEPIAHIAGDGRVHGLEEHLRGVGERAGAFASVFGCGEWGRLEMLMQNNVDIYNYSCKFNCSAKSED